eukprot:m.79699 g.79699  ORF g.79699 m.79699 type:complete len:316 (-) comp8010_c0_seq3:39-986(-)
MSQAVTSTLMQPSYSSTAVSKRSFFPEGHDCGNQLQLLTLRLGLLVRTGQCLPGLLKLFLKLVRDSPELRGRGRRGPSRSQRGFLAVLFVALVVLVCLTGRVLALAACLAAVLGCLGCLGLPRVQRLQLRKPELKGGMAVVLIGLRRGLLGTGLRRRCGPLCLGGGCACHHALAGLSLLRRCHGRRSRDRFGGAGDSNLLDRYRERQARRLLECADPGHKVLSIFRFNVVDPLLGDDSEAETQVRQRFPLALALGWAIDRCALAHVDCACLRLVALRLSIHPRAQPPCSCSSAAHRRSRGQTSASSSCGPLRPPS